MALISAWITKSAWADWGRNFAHRVDTFHEFPIFAPEQFRAEKGDIIDHESTKSRPGPKMTKDAVLLVLTLGLLGCASH